MTDERRLLASGMPLSDALTMRHDLRWDGKLREFVQKKESHACRCGETKNCPGCPNRK